MATRNITDYIGLSRSVSSNTMLTNASKDGGKITIAHKFRALLNESVFEWLVHDGTVHAPHPYTVDKTKSSIYEMPAGRAVKIALAADWASDTVQSEKIAELMTNKKADYTIHLGDTYYSGTEDETKANFLNCWPIGTIASFALLGNHEMYSGGFSFFNTLLPNILKQDNPFFCLRNEHWCILGLDTGYQSIKGKPQNTDLCFEDALKDWLTNVVKLADEKRGIIVLTHHQFISAFKGETQFQNPAKYLRSFFPNDREIIWIWGHEHRFSMYGKYPVNPTNEFITCYGRCIGNGGMPAEIVDVDNSSPYKNALVLWDSREADSFFTLLHPPKVHVSNNGYATIEINGANLEITYYSSYTSDTNAVPVEQAIIKEIWAADNNTGVINCLNVADLTIQNGKSELTYLNNISDLNRVGKSPQV